MGIWKEVCQYVGEETKMNKNEAGEVGRGYTVGSFLSHRWISAFILRAIET